MAKRKCQTREEVEAEKEGRKPRSKTGAGLSEKAAGKRRVVTEGEESEEEKETERQKTKKRAEWEREERAWRRKMELRLKGFEDKLTAKVDALTMDVGIVADFQKQQLAAVRKLAEHFDGFAKEVRQFHDDLEIEPEVEKGDKMAEDRVEEVAEDIAEDIAEEIAEDEDETME